MIGVLPCAGKGSRAGLLYPKELFKVGGAPIIEDSLADFRRACISRVVVVVSPRKPEIRRYLEGRGGFDYFYAVQGQPTGLGDAVLCAEPFAEELMYLRMPDTAIKGYSGLRDAGLALFKVGEPRLFGQVEADESGRVLRIADKADPPISEWAWGAALFGPEIFNALRAVEPRNGERQLTDAFGRVKGMRAVKFPDAEYTDIGGSRLA